MIKESIYNLRRQPVISAVTVIGTALSIFLIMTVVMMQQVKTAPFAPESARDRFLHYDYISFGNSDWGDVTESNSNGPMAWYVVKNLFYPLKTPEAVTAYVAFSEARSLGIRGEKPFTADVRETDANYFRVFDFRFIDGKPFTQADFDAALPRAVIDSNVARRLFGTVKATGKRFDINGGEYVVSGVVEPVSPLADHAYGQTWITTSSSYLFEVSWTELGGYYSVTLLIPEGGSEKELRDEFGRQFAEFGKELKEGGWAILNRNRPYTQEKASISMDASSEPDLDGARRRNLTVYTILLLVPAINLSSMTHSRLRRRVSEIAVRRAFGATRRSVFIDLIGENLLVTLLGGVIGLLLSVVMAFVMADLLFTREFVQVLSAPSVSPSMLLQWSTFGWAMLFCFILNMLSAGMPALQMSRIGIVKSLRGSANGK